MLEKLGESTHVPLPRGFVPVQDGPNFTHFLVSQLDTFAVLPNPLWLFCTRYWDNGTRLGSPCADSLDSGERDLRRFIDLLHTQLLHLLGQPSIC